MKTRKTVTPEQITKMQELLVRAVTLNEKMNKVDQSCSFSYLGHIYAAEFRASDKDYNTIVSEYAYLDWDSEEHNLEAVEKAISEQEARFNDTL